MPIHGGCSRAFNPLWNAIGKPSDSQLTVVMRVVMVLCGFITVCFIPFLMEATVRRQTWALEVLTTCTTVLSGLFLLSAFSTNTLAFSLLASTLLSVVAAFTVWVSGGMLDGSKGMFVCFCSSTRITLKLGGQGMRYKTFKGLKTALDAFLLAAMATCQLRAIHPMRLIDVPPWIDVLLICISICFDYILSFLIVWLNAIHAKKVNEVAEARLNFLTATSHEVRTPLNGLLGCLSVMKHSRGITKEHEDLIMTAEDSGTHLIMVLNHILDIGKIDSVNMVLHREPVHIITELCGAAYNGHMAALRFGGDVTVTLFAHHSLPDVFTGDTIRFRQILINIVQNAVKFTKQGYVHINAKCIHHVVSRKQRRQTVLTEDRILRIEVSDTGKGINSTHLPRVFDRFSEVRDKDFSAFPGTGLGLSLTKSLVTMMGGSIVAYSEGERKGCTFVVDLPVSSDDPPAAETDREIEGSIPIVWLYFAVDNHWRNVIEMYFEDWGVRYINIDGAPPVDTGEPFVIVTHEMPVTDLSLLCDRPISPTRIVILSNGYYEHPPAEIPCEVLRLPVKPSQLRKAISLGARRSAGTLNPIPEPSSPVLLTHRVLIVDDIPINRKILKLILNKCGINNVRECENGRQAVDDCMSNTYDIIFMDLEMPILDGHSAVDEIREFERKSHRTPVFIAACTANGFDEVRRKCLCNGFNEFIVKPITIETIKNFLDDMRKSKTIPFDTSPETVHRGLSCSDLFEFPIFVESNPRAQSSGEF